MTCCVKYVKQTKKLDQHVTKAKIKLTKRYIFQVLRWIRGALDKSGRSKDIRMDLLNVFVRWFKEQKRDGELFLSSMLKCLQQLGLD